jgi:hypothetical protein
LTLSAFRKGSCLAIRWACLPERVEHARKTRSMADAWGGMPEERLQVALREAARISHVVAVFCDRTEHNEPAAAESVPESGRRLRYLAMSIASRIDVDLQQAYADRLAQVEAVSPVEPLLPPPSLDVERARTWRDLQTAQLRHGRHYHPDVFGLAKRDQLVHVSLNLAKITGSVALLFEGDHPTWVDFSRRRLPDMLLFGVKLATLGGERLSAEALELAAGARAL